MQSNTLTFNVDVANNGTTVPVELVRNEEHLNRSVYINKAGGHSVGNRDQLGFYRTAPKINGESRGSLKVTIKLTRDYAVPNASGTGDIVRPAIAEANFTLPVGMTADQLKEIRQRLIAILDDDDVSGDLMVHGEI